MRIKLRTTTSKEYIELERDAPFTIEELAKEYQAEAPYRILLACVDGVDRELTTVIDHDVTIRFYDLRTQSANLAYQRSLSLLYLVAVRDVLGVDADIENSLNRGLYTDIKVRGRVHAEDIRRIDARMRELVRADIPIVKELCTLEEGIKVWKEAGYREKVDLLKEIEDPDFEVRFYELNGYRNYFFGLMLPSTGYLTYFELRKYKSGVLLRFPYYTDPEVIPEYVNEYKMYGAFGEEERWTKLLGTHYLPDMNRAIAENRTKDLILLSEALHEKKISDIADEICRLGRRIVLIAGPSSSGKTSFAHRLRVQLLVNGLQPVSISMDDYFRNREDTPRNAAGEYDYECLGALDTELFNEHMVALLKGETVDLPHYNFLTGIEHAARECSDVGVHAPLLVENAYELFPARTSLNSQQTLKETVTAVVQADVLQALLLHPTVVDALLNHRRQLLVVSNEDETGGG